MPFTFNLQPLLEFRERIEDEKKRDFAAGMGELNRVQLRLQAAQAELEHNIQMQRAALMRYDPRGMEDAFAVIAYLRDQVRIADEVVQAAEQRLAELREKLRDATKDKNVLEKLKERRKEAYMEARRLREEEEIDDANVIRVSNAATKRRESEELL